MYFYSIYWHTFTQLQGPFIMKPLSELGYDLFPWRISAGAGLCIADPEIPLSAFIPSSLFSKTEHLHDMVMESRSKYLDFFIFP